MSTARRPVEENAAPGPGSAAVSLAGLRRLVEGLDWDGMAPSTDRRNLLARLEICEAGGGGREHTASLRELAEAIGVATTTVTAGWLRSLGTAGPERSATWRLETGKGPTPDRVRGGSTSVGASAPPNRRSWRRLTAEQRGLAAALDTRARDLREAVLPVDGTGLSVREAVDLAAVQFARRQPGTDDAGTEPLH
ncbi:hypothetical protein [Streptomyces sp. CBMA156]|uniref:hypothetical protein n=1 Tax=Streptomyces sp. CBMA156 TaxID=1930280 RepID=UPI001661DED8|nr:hypothetical protein [Streptomyces sp. CBMA156]MBD0671640.1 hypothetical protein [Streptomyces sp. CBMA156]